jgi:hypothetical protein
LPFDLHAEASITFPKVDAFGVRFVRGGKMKILEKKSISLKRKILLLC